MNTAPRDGLDVEDEHYTPEQVREWEGSMLKRGTERWSFFARHDDTGELVGFTEVNWKPKQPETVWQMGTAVDPAHRGHALGKWLKAAMIEKLLDRGPAAIRIRTENADSNDAMLGINTALGFRPAWAELHWQVELDALNAYLRG